MESDVFVFHDHIFLTGYLSDLSFGNCATPRCMEYAAESTRDAEIGDNLNEFLAFCYHVKMTTVMLATAKGPSCRRVVTKKMP